MAADRAYVDKLRSLGFRATVPSPKVTTDVHDRHTVDVTEHFNDRVDVTVKPATARLKITQE